MPCAYIATRWSLLILMGAIGQIPAPAAASHVDQYKVAGHMAVYLGVLPPEIVRGHTPEHPDRTAHAGAPRARKSSHLVIALFDTNDGKRLSDAEVYVRVARTGSAGERKKLETMKIGDAVSFGNEFMMSAAGPYRITVEIRAAGAAKPVTAEFKYKHH